MADQNKSFKVGTAPWETSAASDLPSSQAFKVGEAPWEKQDSAPPEESLGRRMTRSTINTLLPIGGAVAGGALATPETLGLGTVPGAVGGYAAGKQAARMANHYILGDPYEANDVKGIVKQTAGDIGEGAMMELGGQVVGKALDVAVPPVSKYIGEKLGTLAETRAAKALGATKAAFKREGQDQILQTGRNALDAGIITPLSSAEEMATRAQVLKSRGGDQMGKVYKAIDEKGASTFNPLDEAVNVENKIGNFYRSPINRGETSQLENTLESMVMRGDKPIPLTEAQALKEELGKVANWKNKLNVTDKEQMARDAYGVVNSAIDKAAEAGSEKVGIDGLKETLQQGKKDYQTGNNALKLLEDKKAAELGNKTAGLTDTIVGVGGYAAMGPKGLALLAAKKGAEKYGNQLAATSADKISKILLDNPQFLNLSQSNPAAFKSIVQKLESRFSSISPADQLPKVADKNNMTAQNIPTKGPDKWVNDGIEKIKAHDSGADSAAIQSVMKSKKGKDLLIQASDLKPNTPAMDKVYAKIKTEYLKGGR